MAIQEAGTGRIIGQEMGAKNPSWKGDKAGSGSIHEWVRNHFTPEPNCEICGCKNNGSKQFDWSNKNHKYGRDRSEWQHVCRSCHNEYDYTHNGRNRPYTLKKKKVYWSPAFPACSGCGRSSVKHKCSGLCSACYVRRKA